MGMIGPQNRGQVVAFNCQEPGGCNYHSEQQGWSGSQGAWPTELVNSTQHRWQNRWAACMIRGNQGGMIWRLRTVVLWKNLIPWAVPDLNQFLDLEFTDWIGDWSPGGRTFATPRPVCTEMIPQSFPKGICCHVLWRKVNTQGLLNPEPELTLLTLAPPHQSPL